MQPSTQPTGQPTSKPTQFTFNTNNNITSQYTAPGMTLVDAVRSGSVGIVVRYFLL
jgi:hypothetical protein